MFTLIFFLKKSTFLLDFSTRELSFFVGALTRAFSSNSWKNLAIEKFK